MVSVTPDIIFARTLLWRNNRIAYPKTPTATAASRRARPCSMSRNASGRMVAVLRGWRSFCTATHRDDTNVSMALKWFPSTSIFALRMPGWTLSLSARRRRQLLAKGMQTRSAISNNYITKAKEAKKRSAPQHVNGWDMMGFVQHCADLSEYLRLISIENYARVCVLIFPNNVIFECTYHMHVYLLANKWKSHTHTHNHFVKQNAD